MVGKPGSKPPPSVSKAFGSAAGDNAQSVKSAIGSTGPKPAKAMAPAPGGMAGGPTPPSGAVAVADRKNFARQLAGTKEKNEQSKNTAEVAKPAKPLLTKNFKTAASKGQALGEFNSASKSVGKGGRSR